MISQDLKKFNLPDSPGVYFFLGDNGDILYIGKATSLKDRVKSYFSRDLMTTRGPLLVKMISEAEKIEYTGTQSVLEALILEAYEIKKHRPFYNSKEKDNKSFNTVVITDEEYPKLMVVRSRNLAHWDVLKKGLKIKAAYGPFPHSAELREALKIIRRIFPYRDEKCPGAEAKRPCFNRQIGLCPGTCDGISKREYRKTVRRIMFFFEGKKDTLIKDIEKEMKALAKAQKFEEANMLKRTLYALEHIQDIALIKRDIERVDGEEAFRIEAYDIAHISGSSTVGVMVVVEDGELAKSQYRKFRIRGKAGKVGVDDTNNLKEVLVRRLGHAEWPLPQLIVVDGGIAQINAAKDVLKEKGFNISVVSVVKDSRHKAREILISPEDSEKILGGGVPPRSGGVREFSQLSSGVNKDILLANAEAHRFAIGYHRKLRGKGFRI